MELIILFVLAVATFFFFNRKTQRKNINARTNTPPEAPQSLGEARLARILNYGLPESEYTIMHNVLLSKNGKTTEIDHIIVSRYGVFVIENKDLHGWVYGTESDKEWRQTIPARIHKYHYFYNPLLQNEGHIRFMMDITDLPRHHFMSLIAFSPRSEYKDKPIENVCTYAAVIPRIKAHSKMILSESDVTNIAITIRSHDSSDKREDRMAHKLAVSRRHH